MKLKLQLKAPLTKDHMDPTVNFYQTLKEDLVIILLKWLHEGSSMTRFVLGSQCCPETETTQRQQNRKTTDQFFW